MSRSIVFAVSSLALVLGCAHPADAESDSEEQDSALISEREPGIEVDASYRLAYVGTPTYGYDPTAPFVTIKIVVDDARIVQNHPGFDGYERAFALVPKMVDGVVQYERLELPFRGRTLRGYMSSVRWVDMHEIIDLRVANDDVAALREGGIAIGLDTNVGTVWAQAPGRNFDVPKRGSL